MKTATAIHLTPEVREQLVRYARGRSVPKRLVERAGIVLRAAEGQQSQLIAVELGLSRPTVQLWRDRFAAQGLAGIVKDAPRPGRKPKLAVALVRRVVKATLETRPPNATHWSVRTMAKAQGLSRMAVQRIWETYELKPHSDRDLQAERRPSLRREAGGCGRAVSGPARPSVGSVRR